MPLRASQLDWHIRGMIFQNPKAWPERERALPANVLVITRCRVLRVYFISIDLDLQVTLVVGAHAMLSLVLHRGLGSRILSCPPSAPNKR